VASSPNEGLGPAQPQYLEDDSYHQNFDLCYNDEHIPSEVALSISSNRVVPCPSYSVSPSLPVILVLDQTLIYNADYGMSANTSSFCSCVLAFRFYLMYRTTAFVLSVIIASDINLKIFNLYSIIRLRLRRAHHQPLLVKPNHVQNSCLRIPQSR